MHASLIISVVENGFDVARLTGGLLCPPRRETSPDEQNTIGSPPTSAHGRNWAWPELASGHFYPGLLMTAHACVWSPRDGGIGRPDLDRPVTPPQVVASIYQAMGIDLETTMLPGPGGRPIRFIEAEPIRELFS